MKERTVLKGLEDSSWSRDHSSLITLVSDAVSMRSHGYTGISPK